jgi:hypothetical protein
MDESKSVISDLFSKIDLHDTDGFDFGLDWIWILTKVSLRPKQLIHPANSLPVTERFNSICFPAIGFRPRLAGISVGLRHRHCNAKSKIFG